MYISKIDEHGNVVIKGYNELKQEMVFNAVRMIADFLIRHDRMIYNTVMLFNIYDEHGNYIKTITLKENK